MKEATDTSTTNSSRGGVMMSVDDILDLVISTEDHDNDESSESYNSYGFRSSSPLSLSMKGDTTSLFVPSMPPTERAKTWHGMPSKTPRNERTRSSRNHRQHYNYYAELPRNELTDSTKNDLSIVGESAATTATTTKKEPQSSRPKHGVSSSQPPLPTTSRTFPNKPNIVESSFMPVEENRHFRSILEEYHKKNQTSSNSNNTEAISRFEIFEKSRRNEKTNGILW